MTGHTLAGHDGCLRAMAVESDKHLIFDATPHAGLRLRERECDFWEPFIFGPRPASCRRPNPDREID